MWKSSNLQVLNRKICTKPGNECLMKKLKNEKDSNGDIQPKDVKRGATDVDCPSGGPQVWSNNGFCNHGQWPTYCRKQFEGSNTDMDIC